MDEPQVVTIIPARGQSKGIPRKNIVPVAGRPLLAWSIERALRSALVDRVFVSTDDDEIAAVSRQWEAEVVMRPPELATDGASSEAALLHALDAIEREHGVSIGTVVFLQATSPVRTLDDIDNALRRFRETGADSLFSCTTVRDFFTWEERDGRYVSLNYDFQNRPRRQEIRPRYLENGSIYIFTPKRFRQERNRLGGRIAIYEMPAWRSHQIDHDDDIGVCELYLNLVQQAKGHAG